MGNARRARLLASLGEIWLTEGDSTQAEQCFETALRFQPGQPVALGGRGRLLLESGEFEAALGLFHDAVRHDPLYTGAWYHYGRALAMAGEVGRAREVLAHALAINQGHRNARQLLERLSEPGAARVAGPPPTEAFAAGRH